MQRMVGCCLSFAVMVMFIACCVLCVLLYCVASVSGKRAATFKKHLALSNCPPLPPGLPLPCIQPPCLAMNSENGNKKGCFSRPPSTPPLGSPHSPHSRTFAG